jgi:hypothetical protein
MLMGRSSATSISRKSKEKIALLVIGTILYAEASFADSG